MTLNDDRTVHARFVGIGEIVRYDRAGKWYIEPFSGRRRHIGIGEAAQRAGEWEANGGVIFLGLPGGQAFDRRVKREAAS